MNLQLQAQSSAIQAEITVSGSKSESNRLLILQQLYPNITIENLSDSDDTHHLHEALSSSNEIADIGHAGTAMRFLTAFFAAQKGVTKVLQGSERMHNRPIEILVDALRSIGADITYLQKEGYPPIKIVGQELTKDKVTINGNVSSQYISALMLIAPSLPNGLSIELAGKITSIPYIKMTLSLLHQLGIKANFKGNLIQVNNQPNVNDQTVVVESDWSSASYFYSLIALSKLNSKVKLTAYKNDSLQGDAVLSQIYNHFGVTTTFEENSIILTKSSEHSNNLLVENLKNAPDIAQTIAVTCFGLGIACDLTGLHTLKIKETDRLEALREELTKLGATINVTNESLHLKNSEQIHQNIDIETYNDHRMAMAFAPLAFKTIIQINEAEVVTKSFRNFWNDMNKIGLQIQEL
ncbi:3-phosphoshikimate 1-carboxyvinyltransferase [Tenacibaculum sp. MAR_2009_124]|uniref:3-phosphoshikimate 1-carboxyvinyltransferase n=1 Tax=Tenacibaculum sp. MAR_2009_124 TaxID=1250059 RepID=UPI000894313A|nr:3-phosphoshikimate 1-carboxyvinyltransferase [Tenacibaculum sp. MAR_2009_124]SED12257.1 3-phosphoshikimate 1-carboxyvinyltransferase [Tenacibaculum sp. MAR_2009_124]